MKLTNRWNRIAYRLWSPVYDGLFDRFFAAPGRRRSMAVLNPQPGERVLLVGVGTGADLPLLPAGVTAVGLDLSPAMLARARAKLPLPERPVTLLQGDAGVLPLGSETFDAALLNLVLSVVPDGAACLRETLRTLKPGGRIVVFDKFTPDGARPGAGRRLINLVTMFFGTDITRRLGDIVAGSPCRIVHDEPSLLRGTYRVVEIRPANSE
ncbi:MAG: methyltransferase domain-containing protein [Chloroflexi bacterium]|nr:methyltransferase domain-containing protein [Chloroflexota bacterium]MBU1747773.1 methyltransferase domain-containing protein [Chloroflexota bacterium]